MKRADRPLAGRRILVTRPAGRAHSLKSVLAALGAKVECRPTIALEAAEDPEPARRAVAELHRYDWLVFTSPVGVRFFLKVHRDVHGPNGTITQKIAAVGPSTARDLSEAGMTPTVVARDTRAEGLVEVLRDRIEPGGRVLVVKPEVARPVLVEALGAMGTLPDPVAFYRNVAAPGTRDVARDVTAGKFDVALFTSSSTFVRLLAAGESGRAELMDALRRMQLVAIGPVTAEAIEREGLEAAGVAREPTDESIVECILAMG